MLMMILILIGREIELQYDYEFNKFNPEGNYEVDREF